MDPFDEFEFKPLTEGLGFHKTPGSLKEQVQSSKIVEDHLTALPTSMPSGETSAKKPMTFDDVISSLERGKPTIPTPSFLEVTEPLPRSEKNNASALQAQSMEMDLPPRVEMPFPSPETFRQPPLKIQKTPQAPSKRPDVGTRRGAADSPQSPLVEASVSVPAAMLDFVVIVAISLLFTVALVSVTKVDLNVIIDALDSDMLTRLSLGVMFLSILQMYVVIARSFFGRTLGEWTFDVQLGRETDQKRGTYIVRVVWRSLLTLFTGIVILPVVSLLVGTDLAGVLSGVQLYRQRA